MSFRNKSTTLFVVFVACTCPPVCAGAAGTAPSGAASLRMSGQAIGNRRLEAAPVVVVAGRPVRRLPAGVPDHRRDGFGGVSCGKGAAWDKNAASGDMFVTYAGKPMEPFTCYCWRMENRNMDNISALLRRKVPTKSTRFISTGSL
ncbi:MAG: hypothetical protein LBS03_01090 [Bacteroidales bacterium]|nr:hypothetical protein [Bacteroidales bacterium]